MNDFSDFHTVEDLKFDINKLKEALKQVLKIKKYFSLYRNKFILCLKKYAEQNFQC